MRETAGEEIMSGQKQPTSQRSNWVTHSTIRYMNVSANVQHEDFGSVSVNFLLRLEMAQCI